MTELITWRQLEKRVPYTRQHVGRLEAAGKFPRRVQVGEARVAWIASEIEEWIAQRAAQREPLPAPGDRDEEARWRVAGRAAEHAAEPRAALVASPLRAACEPGDRGG